MKLTDLEPELLKFIDEHHWRTDATFDDCDGLKLLCPKCFIQNNGRIGTHIIICWKPTVPDTAYPAPGRWNIVGNTFEELSLVAGSSSVLLMSGCKAHFFVQNGNINLC